MVVMLSPFFRLARSSSASFFFLFSGRIDPENRETYRERYGLQGRRLLASSDAHRLTAMRDAAMWLELDDEPYSSQRVRDALIALLREGMAG